MAFQAVPDATKVEIIANRDGTPKYVHTLYMAMPDGLLSQSIADDAAGDVSAQMNAAGTEADLLTNIVWARIVFTELGVEGGLQFDGAGGPFATGTNTGEALPPAVALCTTWRSSLRTKSGRGRTFWAGFAESTSEGGVDSGTLGRWQDFADGLITAFAARGNPLVVVSRFSGNSLEPGPRGQLLVTPTPRAEGIWNSTVTGTVSSSWRQQRRRENP